MVQTVQRNKDDCTQMLEQIHGLLYAIIHLHTNLDASGEVSPKVLENLAKFMETLHKIHTFVESQQERNKIKQLFRQGELSTLLKGCKVGLEQALAVFQIEGVDVLRDMADMQQYAQKRHQEILELISTGSDETSSDRRSSMSNISSASSNSLSLLPSEPKIFHGRQSEVSSIIQAFSQDTPRIAILGAGGMGKTSLARVILHHPEITDRYGERRVFVACDGASSSLQLAAIIGAQVGLKPGKDLTRPVVQHFTTSPPCLLILDNLETIWDSRETRGEVEKFLALLADVDHLALIITMRGAERPANVKWSHPFLEPLKPLIQDAARKTFNDIVDDRYFPEDVDKILNLTGNMPLAIDLIAHLVDNEGLASVQYRWEAERTSLLSDGPDKGSNLDFSISLSLTSPRVTAFPQSQDLLSILSILPDGLSDSELVQSKLPINNILACKATLLRTSLAYTNEQKRLKALVPIREYFQRIHPPMAPLIQPLLQYFHGLLEIFYKYHGKVSNSGMLARITPNVANIQNILLKSLNG
ncbi:P-loop containing nucleoside triphosphate hydrolase protein, partial [Mycena latifolia]